jgi:hypothetical protein
MCAWRAAADRTSISCSSNGKYQEEIPAAVSNGCLPATPTTFIIEAHLKPWERGRLARLLPLRAGLFAIAAALLKPRPPRAGGTPALPGVPDRPLAATDHAAHSLAPRVLVLSCHGFGDRWRVGLAGNCPRHGRGGRAGTPNSPFPRHEPAGDGRRACQV